MGREGGGGVGEGGGRLEESLRQGIAPSSQAAWRATECSVAMLMSKGAVIVMLGPPSTVTTASTRTADAARLVEGRETSKTAPSFWDECVRGGGGKVCQEKRGSMKAGSRRHLQGLGVRLTDLPPRPIVALLDTVRKMQFISNPKNELCV